MKTIMRLVLVIPFALLAMGFGMVAAIFEGLGQGCLNIVKQVEEATK